MGRTAWITGLCWIGLVLGPPALAQDPLEAEPGDETSDDGTLDDEFALLEEETVVFSASRYEQRISESPATVTVITREQIESSPCRDVPCLLRLVPEIEVRNVRPMFQSVGARAMTGELNDRGLVLVDGREINLDAFGLPFWGALPVHLQDIERIEVVRGPGSALYGANAHSMVIAITTRAPEASGAEAFVEAGAPGLISTHLRGALAFEGWWLELSGGAETAGLWFEPDRREKDLQRMRLRLARQWGAGETRIDLGAVRAEGWIYTELAPIELTDSWLAHVVVEHRTDFLQARLWASLFKTDMHFDLPLVIELNGRQTVLGTFPEIIDALSPSVDADINAHWSFWEGNRLLAGVNYRYLAFLSERNTPGAIHQHRFGAYLQGEQRLWDQLLLTLGMRFDYNSITPETLSPRGALIWRFGPEQALRIATGQAFRKPSFFNTSAHLTGIEGSAVTPNLGEFFERSIGNEALGNESVFTTELGYRGSFVGGSLGLELNGFANFYRDSIGFVFDVRYSAGLPYLPNSRLSFENQDHEVVTLGASLALDWRYRETWRVLASYTYRYSWYPNELPAGQIGDAGAGSRKFEAEPDHLAGLALSYRAPFGLTAGLSLHARSGYTQYAFADGALFGERIRLSLPAATFACAHLGWRLDWPQGSVELGLKATNLFGQPYRDTVASTRFDQVEVGGQLVGREIVLYLRGAI